MTDKLLIEALEQYATAIHERAQGRGSSTECATLYAAVLEAAQRSQQEAAQEPSAVVGRDFQLLYTGGEDFSAHARKHGLKVGTKLYTAAPAPSESEAKDDPIRALIAHHASLLDQSEYTYFELAYTRQTGWMAFITDKPLAYTVVNPDRRVIAQGQGDNADEACRAALSASGQKGEPT